MSRLSELRPKLRSDREHSKHIDLLVELANGFYWALDQSHRVVEVRHRDPNEEPGLRGVLGRFLWELCTDDTERDDLRHMLEERKPLVERTLRYIDSDDKERYFAVNGRPESDQQGHFQGYHVVARPIIRDGLAGRLLSLGQVITQLLSAQDEAQKLVVSCLRAICVSEEWDAAHYWRLDEEANVLRRDATWTAESQAPEETVPEAQEATLTCDGSSPGTVWRTQAPLWVPDVRSGDRPLGGIAEQVSASSAFLVPMIVSNLFVGVLEFNARRLPQPDELLVQFVQTLAGQIGLFREQLSTLRRLRESNELYTSTFELAAIGIAHVRSDGHFLHVNRQLCTMLGYSKSELLGLTFRAISHPDDADVTSSDRARLHAGEIDSLNVEKRYVRKDGTTIWVRLTSAVKRDDAGKPLYDISIVEDISERQRAEEQIRYLATHDEMTGLPNRTMFEQLLNHAIEMARRHNRQCAVLFFDLDRFKVINDSLGHQAGDELLKEIATRLSRRLRSSDVLARLGGDEFVVLLDQIRGGNEADTVARKVLAAILVPFEIMGRECRVTASIGIAKYPADADTASSLMRCADLAMYHAKEEGKNNFQWYSKEISLMSVEQLTLETHLRRALENDEFTLQYQAKVDLQSGRIGGTEALLRWWNHDLGTVSPAQFIAVAEESGLIVPLGRWVLRTACAQNVEWQRRGLPRIVMAVNLSPRQFKDPRLLDDIAEILEETGMSPDLLELEITESMIMTSLERAGERVAAIKKLGVRLAIDDFGTGYSSLSQLKRFPIDTLKIDRSFIRDIPANEEDQAITQAIISMGRTLGVTVVAEGVETIEQQQFLDRHRCDQMQGFLFSKPCHPDAFAELLRSATACKVGED